MSEEVSMKNAVIENQVENNSGQGSNSPVPDNVAKNFSWGAFGFNWIWCLVYRQYLFAIVILITYFIPVVGALASLCLMIFFGVKGNTWAWQAKHYKSVDEFHKIHKIWASWVVVVINSNYGCDSSNDASVIIK